MAEGVDGNIPGAVRPVLGRGGRTELRACPWAGRPRPLPVVDLGLVASAARRGQAVVKCVSVDLGVFLGPWGPQETVFAVVCRKLLCAKKELKANATIAGTFSPRERGPGLPQRWDPARWEPGRCILVPGAALPSGLRRLPCHWAPRRPEAEWDPPTGSRAGRGLRLTSARQAGQRWTAPFEPPGAAVPIWPCVHSLLVSCVT